MVDDSTVWSVMVVDSADLSVIVVDSVLLVSDGC